MRQTKYTAGKRLWWTRPIASSPLITLFEFAAQRKTSSHPPLSVRPQIFWFVSLPQNRIFFMSKSLYFLRPRWFFHMQIRAVLKTHDLCISNANPLRYSSLNLTSFTQFLLFCAAKFKDQLSCLTFELLTSTSTIWIWTGAFNAIRHLYSFFLIDFELFHQEIQLGNITSKRVNHTKKFTDQGFSFIDLIPKKEKMHDTGHLHR